MARKKHRRRVKAPRVSKAASDRATIAKQAVAAREPHITVISEVDESGEPRFTAIDLLRRDQDSPPVVIR